MQCVSTLPFVTVTIDPTLDKKEVLAFVLAQPNVKIVELDQIMNICFEHLLILEDPHRRGFPRVNATFNL